MRAALSDLIDRYLVSYAGVPRARLADRSVPLSELGLDTFGITEILADFEQRFGVRVDDPERYERMSLDATIDDLMRLIGGGAPAPPA